MTKYGSSFSKCLQPIIEIAACFRLRFQDLFKFLAIAYATGPRYPVASWYMAHLHSISALPRKTVLLHECQNRNENSKISITRIKQRLMLVVFSLYFLPFPPVRQHISSGSSVNMLSVFLSSKIHKFWISLMAMSSSSSRE